MKPKTIREITALIFGLIQRSDIPQSISGGVYTQDERPDDSHKEDIVLSTIATDIATYPQRAVSSVNIYVPDQVVVIEGRKQTKANGARLDELARAVLSVIEAERLPELELFASSLHYLRDERTRQHFVHIRIEWYLH